MLPPPEELPTDAWDRREDPEIRELLVRAYWPMLTRIVGKLRQGIPNHDEEDLREWGAVGLLKAIDRYEQSRGPFDKFASNYVRGAVLDSIRAQDWAPRTLRKKQKELARAEDWFMAQNNSKPSEEQLAEVLDWSVDEVAALRTKITNAAHVSLDGIHAETQSSYYEFLAPCEDSAQELGRESNGVNAAQAEVTNALRSFTAQERAVIIFRYFFHLKQTEIAALLGVSTAKVGSIHKKVAAEVQKRLREHLSDD